MEIKNLKEIELSFENMQYAKFDASEIRCIIFESEDYIINNDKVYRLLIELPVDKKYINKISPNDKYYGLYHKDPIRHLYNWDNVDDVELYYKDGSKSRLIPYWGKFSDNEINLYQHGKYEVENGRLTDKFILELYIEKLSNDLQVIMDERRKTQDYIYETLWEFDPMDFVGFGNIRPVNVYRREILDLLDYIYYNEKPDAFEFKEILIDSLISQWGKKAVDSHKKRVEEAAEYIFNKLVNKYKEEK